MAHPSIDPTFYRTAAEAAAAPGEQLAYVVAFDRAAQKHDAMTVVDVDPASDSYGRVVGWTDVPGLGDELHHFGWNACSSALKHEGHDMHGLAAPLPPGSRAAIVQHPRVRHPARTRATRRWLRRSTARSCRQRPDTRVRTPFTADPTAYS